MDLSLIDDYELVPCGGYPEFVDSYIARAWWKDGTELNDEELEELNDDSEFVYDCVINHYF